MSGKKDLSENENKTDRTAVSEECSQFSPTNPQTNFFVTRVRRARARRGVEGRRDLAQKLTRHSLRRPSARRPPRPSFEAL